MSFISNPVETLINMVKLFFEHCLTFTQKKNLPHVLNLNEFQIWFYELSSHSHTLSITFSISHLHTHTHTQTHSLSLSFFIYLSHSVSHTLPNLFNSIGKMISTLSIHSLQFILWIKTNELNIRFEHEAEILNWKC